MRINSITSYTPNKINMKKNVNTNPNFKANVSFHPQIKEYLLKTWTGTSLSNGFSTDESTEFAEAATNTVCSIFDHTIAPILHTMGKPTDNLVITLTPEAFDYLENTPNGRGFQGQASGIMYDKNALDNNRLKAVKFNFESLANPEHCKENIIQFLNKANSLLN